MIFDGVAWRFRGLRLRPVLPSPSEWGREPPSMWTKQLSGGTPHLSQGPAVDSWGWGENPSSDGHAEHGTDSEAQMTPPTVAAVTTLALASGGIQRANLGEAQTS